MSLRDTVTSTVTNSYETIADSVSSQAGSGRGLVPSAQQVATGIGLGRVLIGATFLAAPRLSVRLLGVDSASAKRMAFLARMAAARDIGLGAGTLDAGPGRAAVPWLLAGAACDVVDAAAITGATRSGITRGAPAVGTALGALGVAAAALWAVSELRRSG